MKVDNQCLRLKQLPADVARDSSVLVQDPDEVMDMLGELRSFTRPPSANTPISILFLVDLSASMKKRDIAGRPNLRRIDAVAEVLKCFIVQQQSAGAVMDLYSLVCFSHSNYDVRFQRRSGSEAIAALSSEHLEPGGHVKYERIVCAIKELAVPGQACRAIFMSDACCGDLKWLLNFQALFSENPHVFFHCIGFGGRDLSILQQLAQIGRGSFSCASLDMDNLVNTFSSLSKTVTETRNAVDYNDRKSREVIFDSAGRFQGRVPSIKERMAFRYTFSLRQGQLQIRTKEACNIRVHRNPFMQGGMRLVYRFHDPCIKTKMVAKLSRYVEHDSSWDFVKGFVNNTAQTRLLTQKFHDAVWWALAGSIWDQEPPRLVSCTQAWAYDVAETQSFPRMLLVAEAFLQGSERGFFKWVNNRGEVLVPSSSREYSMAVEAFAHFSLDYSHGKLMVADLQGVLRPGEGQCRRVHLTDPQILSLDQDFGPADLGSPAMQKFRSLHVCNGLCRRLHLTSLNAVPQAPHARSTLLNVRSSPARPAAPPPLPPKSVAAHPQQERGRSPTRRDETASIDRHGSDRETLKAQEILLSKSSSAAKRMLFVGECTHLFTVAAAKLVSAWLGQEHPQLDWCTTELRWPGSDSMSAELRASEAVLHPFGISIRDGVDATRLDLPLQGLASAVWAAASAIAMRHQK